MIRKTLTWDTKRRHQKETLKWYIKNDTFKKGHSIDTWKGDIRNNTLEGDIKRRHWKDTFKGYIKKEDTKRRHLKENAKLRH